MRNIEQEIRESAYLLGDEQGGPVARTSNIGSMPNGCLWAKAAMQMKKRAVKRERANTIAPPGPAR
jgi:hypothetical protein